MLEYFLTTRVTVLERATSCRVHIVNRDGGYELAVLLFDAELDYKSLFLFQMCPFGKMQVVTSINTTTLQSIRS